MLWLSLGACSSYGEADSPETVPAGVGDASVPANGGGRDAKAPGSDAGSDGGGDANACLACERIVFVTSSSQDGSLGGLAGADDECNALAAKRAGTMGRSYRAWLSLPGVGPEASDRLVHGENAYRRTDGVLVAASFAALTSGALAAPIDRDETGTQVPPNGVVWTGTDERGRAFSSTCGGWLGTAGNGATGNLSKNNFEWSRSVQIDCALSARLYCIEN